MAKVVYVTALNTVLLLSVNSSASCTTVPQCQTRQGHIAENPTPQHPGSCGDPVQLPAYVHQNHKGYCPVDHTAQAGTVMVPAPQHY